MPMEPMQNDAPAMEYDELIDMRTHLTVAVLAAAQLRRTLRGVPNAARFDGYLDQALRDLVEDVRKVDGLIAQTRVQVPGPEREAASTHGARMQRAPLPVRLVCAPFHLVRKAVGICWRQAQRHVLTRPMALSDYR
jgi:hypothetical protein